MPSQPKKEVIPRLQPNCIDNGFRKTEIDPSEPKDKGLSVKTMKTIISPWRGSFSIGSCAVVILCFRPGLTVGAVAGFIANIPMMTG
jgi:hypothetical protein